MSDRELLEAAAKAIGVTGEYVERHRIVTDCGIQRVTGIMVGGEYCWNPLEDDGDRYRLARKLKMRIDWREGKVCCGRTSEYKFTPGNEDEEAYAIVRAAAASCGWKSEQI